jgi:hypothetical protein
MLEVNNCISLGLTLEGSYIVFVHGPYGPSHMGLTTYNLTGSARRVQERWAPRTRAGPQGSESGREWRSRGRGWPWERAGRRLGRAPTGLGNERTSSAARSSSTWGGAPAAGVARASAGAEQRKGAGVPREKEGADASLPAWGQKSDVEEGLTRDDILPDLGTMGGGGPPPGGKDEPPGPAARKPVAAGPGQVAGG